MTSCVMFWLESFSHMLTPSMVSGHACSPQNPLVRQMSVPLGVFVAVAGGAVRVGVADAVFVRVAVDVAVDVGVPVAVAEPVAVAVGVALLVGVAVFVAVLVAVL